ncbi:phytanoyl-CoA dioxygenase family protein [Rubripirellula reticaptiva]|uniref:Phytanoyl-CoA dioxygenase (PhyH) n=1 Tax=Rubripirellula reticaptiva TaxID=2528013 RepID=A0A5C6FAR3_9BACT|nr:phytanoyl-CoA dioxygenase family protein [Rubripirellula reticaptiva]TWU57627.1 Phytanoyl-CoA dioxygenase (PhyH) [Rubripirellula reticaptiva]
MDADLAEGFSSRGFAVLEDAVDASTCEMLRASCERVFAESQQSALARSSRGHVYAARNVITAVPVVKSLWRQEPLLGFLRHFLGDEFGLVRVLFFDKPPDRTWALPWHKDTAIAVKNNSIESPSFSRPTLKAGVPHLVACDSVLARMLTLRLHLDEVTDDNGPLKVIPRSHVSSSSEGDGAGAAVTIYASVGGVLAMRPLISHSSGSSVPGTTRHRRILHLEFSADRRLPDGVEWHEFVSLAD